jgi:hypothetical protein
MDEALRLLAGVPIWLLLLWIVWALFAIAVGVATANAGTRNALADAGEQAQADISAVRVAIAAARAEFHKEIVQLGAGLGKEFDGARRETQQQLNETLLELRSLREQLDRTSLASEDHQ